jgi:hypothetical protein
MNALHNTPGTGAGTCHTRCPRMGTLWVSIEKPGHLTRHHTRREQPPHPTENCRRLLPPSLFQIQQPLMVLLLGP